MQAEIEEEKLRKRQQGVLVEEHGSSMDVDDAKTRENKPWYDMVVTRQKSDAV